MIEIGAHPEALDDRVVVHAVVGGAGMIEDKLTGGQRLRLEAVAQANMRLGPRGSENPTQAVKTLLDAAVEIERYIRGISRG